MRFNLVDRIVSLEPGRSIQILKNLTSGEEYLRDHFPTFPVMPGVLMLQTLVEAGAWLLRITDDFRYSVIVMREVKQVKFGQFMEPGRQMIVTVTVETMEGSKATFKGKGETEGKQTVTARFTLARYNLADQNPAKAETDSMLTTHWQRLYGVIQGDSVGRKFSET